MLALRMLANTSGKAVQLAMFSSLCLPASTSSLLLASFIRPTPSFGRRYSSSEKRVHLSPSPTSSSCAGSTRISDNIGRKIRVQNKPLPSVPNRLPYLAAFVATALASWAAFAAYATNNEKLSSSVFKSVVSQVKSSSQVAQLLSSPTCHNLPKPTSHSITLKPKPWLGVTCRVKGSVNMMQGRVDLSFKITNAPEKTNTGTVYFTSVRANKHAPFEILRFLVVNDKTGESISLLDHGKLSTIDVDSGDIVQHTS
ncbi:uncharacterized protein UBRO_20475 [Ustilago bromivora]|uniref:Uncharacterized protein n=1 Tax=Ustilago bromivora TaxID=307758 RepID=A0A1K0H162_9BASI|nr:uncharacterized protein UBRO_20475 [Ustilago bromivora]